MLGALLKYGPLLRYVKPIKNSNVAKLQKHGFALGWAQKDKIIDREFDAV